MSIESRHAGHGHGNHFANVKYGHIIFGISVAYALYVSVARYLYLRKWNNQAKAPTGLVKSAAYGNLWVSVVFWTFLILFLSFINVENLATMWVIVIKRLGRVGYCLVPLDAVLALRPACLGPHALYLEHLALHKWLSRVIVVATTAHGIGYWVKWIIELRFWAQNVRYQNFLGVVPFLMSVLLLAVSIRPARRKIYAFFYIWHNATVFAFTFFMLWHARPGVTDVLIFSFCIYGLQVFLRIKFTHRLEKMTIVDPEDSQLRLVKLQKPPNYPAEWIPGSHLRMSWKITNWKYWVYPTHPYSIGSLPGDATIDLVIKKGFRFEMFSSLEYSISLPYCSVPPPLYQTADNVHVICGGSGISLGVPIYRYLKQNSSVITNMTWCVRNDNDVFVLPSTMDPIDVYVTKAETTLFVNNNQEEDHGLLNKDVELELLDGSGTSSPPELAVNFKKGRPIFDEIFAHFGDTAEPDNKWIVVCGPSALIEAVKKWGKVNHVHVFEELYDM
ncbi:hypothetical protein C7M61_000144 [Candidozyma pseudohaemuli]|uniref:Probable metalloreductase AIM14 n=1 Tax=Candidozyma pseudohaemuli TaxID=418784 RepID=A0A2P7YX14_9ASCO|nr:hypothetical protein C7M61_000144 [[Candida] pseudohaemulonii]PSK40499.1 hypothetical protein C7M61_000144 [[Candida] pseudohaemulonii]